MNAYLLNLTIIWLAGLLCYYLFLKRETYHGLNRTYLLLSLLLGLYMPLLQMPTPDHLQYIPFQQPLHHFTAAKQNMIQSFTPVVSTTAAGPHQSFNWLLVVKYVYGLGCLASLVLMLKAIFTIATYYRNGKKQSAGKWVIIETNQQHGPFSLLQYIFVNNRKQYDDAQWKIIIEHEQAHGKLFHFGDLLFLELLQIIFWFHPLVYIYRKKLLLIHEYQADERAATERKYYGHFLIEQSLLQSAPALTHSFNHLPLKHRITMLTRSSSSRIHLLKLAIILPLIAVSFICCTRNGNNVLPSHKQSKLTDTVIHLTNGDLVYSVTQPDTLHIPGQKGFQPAISIGPLNMKYNGVAVLRREDVDTQPVYTGPGHSLGKYVFNELIKEFNLHYNGYYGASFGTCVIDQEGRIIYLSAYSVSINKSAVSPLKEHSIKGLLTQMEDTTDNYKNLSKEQYNHVSKMAQELVVDKILFRPAMKDGKPVPYEIMVPGDLFDTFINFKLQDGNITIQKSPF